jgi:hypothetical protein
MEADHAHPGTGDDRRTEMAVKLHDLGQPHGIGGLPVVIGRGQVVLCNGKCRQSQEKGGGDELRHG